MEKAFYEYKVGKIFTNGELLEIVLYELSKNPYHVNSVAGACLKDRERTLTLMEIISETTPPDSVGVDLGAGSGILGFAFLNAGGKFLYSVEQWTGLVEFIQTMARELRFDSRIQVIAADATKFEPPQGIDYVIAELVCTGLVGEPLVKAIQNIKQHTNPDALFIPQGAKSRITLLDSNGNPISEPLIYDDIFLPKLDRNNVDITVQARVIRGGYPHFAAIDTDLTYPKGKTTGRFDFLCSTCKLELWDGKTQKDYNDQRQLDFRENHHLPQKIFQPRDVLYTKVMYNYGTPKSDIFVNVFQNHDKKE